MPATRKRFHFDLSRLDNKARRLYFHVGTHRHIVRAHTEETRAAAVRDNHALAQIPASHHHRITHYADVQVEHLPTDRLCRIKVTHDHPDLRFDLPTLVHASFHIPAQHRAEHRKKKFAQAAPQVHPKLLAYGVEAIAPLPTQGNSPSAAALIQTENFMSFAAADTPALSDAVAPAQEETDAHAMQQAISEGADHFQTPLDIAAFILFHHPGLASSDPQTAVKVMDDHVGSPENHQALNDLALVISALGVADEDAGGWATIVHAKMPDGTPMTFDNAFGSHAAGDPVEQYELAQEVLDAMPAALKQPLKSVANDPSLQNEKWSVTQGMTAVHQTDGATLQPSQTSPMGAAATASLAAEDAPQVSSAFVAQASDAAAATPSAPASRWTLVNQTGSHGLEADQDSIQFTPNAGDAGGSFQINVKNTYLRTLCAYVQFYDEGGNPINDPAGWTSNLPGGLSHLETSSKKYLHSITAVNNIMGIPMPTDSTTLSFPWPADATHARLLFGGIGTSNWDGDVCPSGLILTGIFQYGIPLFFIAAVVGIKSTSFYKDFVSDSDNVAAVLAVAFPIVGGGVATAAALTNTKKVLFSFASIVAGMIFKKGLEKLAAYVTSQVSEEEAEGSIPFVGWGIRALEVAATFAQIAETTGEVLSSPAALEFDVKRAFDLKVTVTPDPAHGMPNKPETAVWPAVSDHYHVTVQYKGGTNFVQSGQMATTTSNAPLSLTFSDLPAGGKIQIIAGIYSQSGWLCGKWTSAWIDAVPTDGATLTVPPGAITEMLVPLTTDSQYAYKEKIVYDASQQKHVWRSGSPPTATLLSLNSSNTTPPDLRLSQLVNLTISEKTFEIGYTWQASPMGSSQGLPMDFATTPNSGQAYAFRNLSVLADPDSQLKFPNRSFGSPSFIVYDQFGPPPDNSAGVQPHHFFLDPRNAQYHLRQLTLDDNNPVVDLSGQLPSWGQFPLPHVDTIVINSGYAIAASWSDHKLAILKIPDASSADADAPTAVLVSGEGTRQGLVKGPVAMTVTPDGRLLVLETLNARIQSFDIHANPVPAFDGAKLFSVPASGFAADLDAGTFSPALRAQFQQNHASSSPQPVMASPNNVTVRTRKAGQQWIVKDGDASLSYDVQASAEQPGTLDVYEYLSYMPLHNPTPEQTTTYLDMASEAKGYIYVLSYAGDGSQPADYFLDIYEPNGAFLCRTPDARLTSTPQNVVAARLAVDTWRNAFTLNYEALAGPNGGTEPSISEWIPMPPLFAPDLSNQPAFDNADTAKVSALFSQQDVPITLQSGFTIKTVSAAGHWQVTDGNTIYDIVRSGDALNVYKLAPGATI